MDKKTQVSLGLTHGLPAWYKRAHANKFATLHNGTNGGGSTSGESWRTTSSGGGQSPLSADKPFVNFAGITEGGTGPGAMNGGGVMGGMDPMGHGGAMHSRGYDSGSSGIGGYGGSSAGYGGSFGGGHGPSSGELPTMAE